MPREATSHAHAHGHHPHNHYPHDQRLAHQSTHAHSLRRRRSRDQGGVSVVDTEAEHARLGEDDRPTDLAAGPSGSKLSGNGNSSAAKNGNGRDASGTGSNTDPTLPAPYTSVDSAEGFWNEIDALLTLPPECGLLEMDNTLRMFVRFCGAYHGELRGSALPVRPPALDGQRLIKRSHSRPVPPRH